MKNRKGFSGSLTVSWERGRVAEIRNPTNLFLSINRENLENITWKEQTKVTHLKNTILNK